MILTEQREMIARFMGDTGKTRVSNNKIIPYLPTYDIWQTLMPVVEKLDSTEVSIHIDEDRVYVHFPNSKMMTFTNTESGSKIMAIYKAVCAGVEFLERLDKTAKAL